MFGEEETKHCVKIMGEYCFDRLAKSSRKYKMTPSANRETNCDAWIGTFVYGSYSSVSLIFAISFCHHRAIKVQGFVHQLDQVQLMTSRNVSGWKANEYHTEKVASFQLRFATHTKQWQRNSVIETVNWVLNFRMIQYHYFLMEKRLLS